jgi:hypothetical protein
MARAESFTDDGLCPSAQLIVESAVALLAGVFDQLQNAIVVLVLGLNEISSRSDGNSSNDRAFAARFAKCSQARWDLLLCVTRDVRPPRTHAANRLL